jgi:group I intron endonuclease
MIRPDELNGCSRTYISGIYQIKNLINGKIYIGSSNHLYRRYSDHIRFLNRNSHFNPKLQASWNKYGGDNFEFSVLEYCLPIRLVELEQLYINRLHPYFNISMEVGIPNTPKAGTLEAKLRSQKNLESRKRNGKESSPEFRKARSKISLEVWSRDGYRKSRSVETSQLWNNPEYRNKQKLSHTKISDLDKSYITRLYELGYKPQYIIEAFGVSRGSFNRIVNGLQ